MNGRTRSVAANVRRFLLHFLEMQIPMSLGALVCYLVVSLTPASSSFATIYHPGTYIFTAGDISFLTVPVVAWMIFRGHGWRDGLEMAFAMLAPVVAIIVVGQLAGYAYLLWLVTAGYPAMSLGMLAAMLYRHKHFMGNAFHAEDGPAPEKSTPALTTAAAFSTRIDLPLRAGTIEVLATEPGMLSLRRHRKWSSRSPG